MAQVSVIIPVYNLEKYLEKCVESVLSQVFCDYEILLIDDGSTDKSLSVCESLARRDNRIRVYSKSNGGVSSARNYGISRANGKYITFIDGDDLVTPYYLSTFMEDLRGKDYDLISVCMRGRSLPDAVFDFTKPITEHFEVLGKLHGACCRLYKTAIIRENNICFDERILLAEDTLFVYDYLVYCKSMKTHEAVLYTYTSTPGSAIHKHYADVGNYMRRNTDAQVNFLKTLPMRQEWSDAVIGASAYANFKYAMNDYAFNEGLRKAEKNRLMAETYSSFGPELNLLKNILRDNSEPLSMIESEETVGEMKKITELTGSKKVCSYFNMQKKWADFRRPFRKVNIFQRIYYGK